MQRAFSATTQYKETGLSEQDLVQDTMGPLLAFCRAQHKSVTCNIKGHVGITKLTRPAPCLKYTHTHAHRVK